MNQKKFLGFLGCLVLLFQSTAGFCQEERYVDEERSVGQDDAIIGLGLGVHAQLSIDPAYTHPQGTAGSGAHFLVRLLAAPDRGAHVLYQLAVDARYNVFSYNDRGLGTAASARVEGLIIGTMNAINQTGCNFYAGVHFIGSVGGGYMQTRPLQTAVMASTETGVLCITRNGSIYTITPTVGVGLSLQTQRATATTPRGAATGLPLVMGTTFRYIQENTWVTINAMLLPAETGMSGSSSYISADFTRRLGGTDWAMNLQAIFNHYDIQRSGGRYYSSDATTVARSTYDLFGGLTFMRLF